MPNQQNQQFLIAIAVILGLLGVLGAAIWKLGTLSATDSSARDAFLKLMDPASLVSLLILLGVLFLLGMAILDLDKGRVLRSELSASRRYMGVTSGLAESG